MKELKAIRDSRLTRLFLVLENRLLREALAAILCKQQDFQVAGAIRYSPAAHKQIAESECDILLADQETAMSSPANFLPNLITAHPKRRVILLGMEDDSETFLQAVRSGVSGYLLGDASAEDAIAAIRRVVSGEAIAPPSLCFHLFQFVAKTAREGSMVVNQRLCTKLGLTARQQQLTALLVRGLTNKEIAANLNLSEFTVKNHVHRIMRRLKADSRYAAVQTVCENSLSAAV